MARARRSRRRGSSRRTSKKGFRYKLRAGRYVVRCPRGRKPRVTRLRRKR